MSITAERKSALITEYARNQSDTGSPEVQIAILTERINNLTEHCKDEPQGHGVSAGIGRHGEFAPQTP